MHIRDLDLTQIRLIAELANLGSVSAASRKIGLSPSAASHALAKLRQKLGDPLFARTKDGFEPTPYGERLGLAAREALDLLVAGLASNRAFDPKTTTRRFTFYMSDVGQMVLLPRLLAFLKREAPGATVRSAPIPLENPGAGLSSGEVDLAIGFFTNLTTGFRQSRLFREQNSVDNIVRHAGRRDGLRVPGFHVLPLIIANSDLVAFIPARLAESVAAHVPIKVLPPPVPIPPFDIHMFWHERYHHDPTSRWLRRAFVGLFHAR